jgi:hypothetical protein
LIDERNARFLRGKVTTKHKAKDMTKAELVRAVQTKVRKASPAIRRGTFSTKDLMRLKKSELQRRLRKARVITSGRFKGDVEFF